MLVTLRGRWLQSLAAVLCAPRWRQSEGKVAGMFGITQLGNNSIEFFTPGTYSFSQGTYEVNSG